MQFDKIHNRIGTNSDKWDSLQSLYGLSPNEAIPMWVADMDFEAPEAVTNCIREMAEQGIYGYAREDDNYRQAIVSWMHADTNGKFTRSVLSVHGIVMLLRLPFRHIPNKRWNYYILPVYHAFSRVISFAEKPCRIAIGERFNWKI